MELSSIKHIDPTQLADFKANIFITTLGFETRSTTVARMFEKSSCKKIALEMENGIKEFSYQDNSSYFEAQGFDIFRVESEVPDVDAIFHSLTGAQINVLIDCTSMSPNWYYEFFRWFYDKQDREGRVRMRIVYTMANYVRQPGSRKVKEIYDFQQADIKPPNGKKVALILGLGQEKNVSESIYKMINPDLLYLFYADPPVEKRFVEKVLVNNHKLINKTPIRNLVAYPIRNGQAIYQSLIDTILPLRDEYSIVLIPQGPKFFSVVTMLVHMGYPDIRISYPLVKTPPAADRLPEDVPVVLDILFEGEE
ncbi:MAG: hypothetical protein K8R52_12115 [Bacteroidales bacterium]|nr:hypothetical protein [Bacteroidales bacterium]